MTDKNTKDRRKVLLGIAGGAMGANQIQSWTKPVVENVLLPAHAETSGAGGEPGAGTTMAATTAPQTTMPQTKFDYFIRRNQNGASIQTEQQWYADVLDTVVPSAIAGTTEDPSGPGPSIISIAVDGTQAMVSFRSGRNNREFGGMVSTSGTPTDIPQTGFCGKGSPSTRNVAIIGYVLGDTNVTLRISERFTQDYVVPEAEIEPFGSLTCEDG